MAQLNRGRVSVPAQAALSGSHRKASGFAGGYLLRLLSLESLPEPGPAFAKLREMGFANVKVLYLANNFGTDWADKGFPVERGN